MASFSGVTFVWFSFVFVFMVSLKPRSLVISPFDMQRRPDSHTCFIICYFCLFGDAAWRMAYGGLKKKMDAAPRLGRNPVSKHQIQPEYGE